MGRTHRSHMPGAAFHLAARTQGRQPWFSDSVRTRIVEYIAHVIRTSDSSLLAYAVMPNHLHLVVRQGESELGRLMQPLLCRIALLVHRHHGIEGHVFERPFRDTPCLHPRHIRNAIVYSHLNPVWPGLSDHALDYRWSSRALYMAEDAEPKCMHGVLAIETALRLFAPQEGAGLTELRQSYDRHEEWRIQLDRHDEAEKQGKSVGPPPSRPSVSGGDLWWSRTFVPIVRPRAEPPPLDLGDIAKQTLAECAPTLSLDLVRSPCKFRAVVRVRRTMVARMSAAGHKGNAIARYLRVSDQCVSNILTARRENPGRPIR